MDFVDPGLIFCISLTFDIIISLVSKIRLLAINCGLFLWADKRSFEADIKMTFSNAMKADCILWYTETKIPVKLRRMFRANYGKNKLPPQDGSIKVCNACFKGTGSISAQRVR